jgi:hypothetical protein
MAKAGLRWQDEHAQAVADVVARAHGNVDKVGFEAGRTARLKQQASDIVNGLKEASRTKSYAQVSVADATSRCSTRPPLPLNQPNQVLTKRKPLLKLAQGRIGLGK